VFNYTVQILNVVSPLVHACIVLEKASVDSKVCDAVHGAEIYMRESQ
jgi:hypothetical protein